MLLVPFTPLVGTLALVAASTAPTGIQPTTTVTTEAQQIEIYNSGTVPAFIGYGATAAAAQTASAAPSGSTAQNVVVIPPGTSKRYSFPPNMFFSGYASSNSTCYLTVGKGV